MHVTARRICHSVPHYIINGNIIHLITFHDNMSVDGRYMNVVSNDILNSITVFVR